MVWVLAVSSSGRKPAFARLAAARLMRAGGRGPAAAEPAEQAAAEGEDFRQGGVVGNVSDGLFHGFEQARAVPLVGEQLE